MKNPTSAKPTNNRIMSVLGLVLTVVLIPILIINITMIAKSFLYPDQVPSFLGYKPFIVLSGSMEPEFYSGDIVVIKEVNVDTLQEKDVIAFKKGESVITHRIMDITEKDNVRQYVTKGDKNNMDDNITVTDEMVEGKYLLRIAQLGNVAMFMQTPVGILIFVVFPLILFIIYDILHRQLFDMKERKRTSELEAEIERLRRQTGPGLESPRELTNNE
jgi:signal peptidase